MHSFSLGVSFPSWERGLKRDICRMYEAVLLVVPLVGTWIETCLIPDSEEYREVVPLVGTWIETLNLK